MVTHNLMEAVSLSKQLLIMDGAPASIQVEKLPVKFETAQDVFIASQIVFEKLEI